MNIPTGGTPKDLRGAVKNALYEVVECPTDQDVERVIWHIQERLSQDFTVHAIGKPEATEEALISLFKKVFP